MTWLIDERPHLIAVRAERPGSPGSLPANLRLPDLVPVIPEPPYGSGDACAWLTAEPVVDPSAICRRLRRCFDRSGLWPFLAPGWERPFRAGEVSGPAPVPDPITVFEKNWEGIRLVTPDGTPLPHPPWPGLAAPSGPPDPDRVPFPDVADGFGAADLLLVPTTRPADVMAQLGWYGACNWFLSGADISAILRTWEDRFGAYLVSIGFAEFTLVVTRPPTTDDQCLMLADEHYAFCPDNFYPQTLEPPHSYTREEYAERLRGARSWHFWWD